jgi:hypothetical protein
METIIVKPRNEDETKVILGLLKKMKIRAQVFKERSKVAVLNDIEKGAKSASGFIKGRNKLQNAKDLLNEL